MFGERRMREKDIYNNKKDIKNDLIKIEGFFKKTSWQNLILYFLILVSFIVLLYVNLTPKFNYIEYKYYNSSIIFMSNNKMKYDGGEYSYSIKNGIIESGGYIIGELKDNTTMVIRTNDNSNNNIYTCNNGKMIKLGILLIFIILLVYKLLDYIRDIKNKLRYLESNLKQLDKAKLQPTESVKEEDKTDTPFAGRGV